MKYKRSAFADERKGAHTMARFNTQRNRLKRQIRIDDSSFNILLILLAGLLLILLVTGIYFISLIASGTIPGEDSAWNEQNAVTYPYRKEITVTVPETLEQTAAIPAGSIKSEFAALIDLTTGELVASRHADRQIYPASMVKVMTLIVTVENLENEAAMNRKITISQAVYDEMTAAQASGYKFLPGETPTVRDLIHAMILKSDGIAAVTLAEYIAGSEEAFVAMMNQKAADMGLSKTVFKNCTGLHDDGMISTAKEIAVIMNYAMQNPFCANILSTESYTFSDNIQPGNRDNPMPHMNLERLKNYASQLTTVMVKAAKSGYTERHTSGSCLVSYAVGNNGHKYILVTAKAPGRDDMYGDLVYIYNQYAE